MDFNCELKQVQSKKSVSNDMVYKLILETDNPLVMDLGKLPSDTLFDVSITLHSNTVKNKRKENDGIAI